MDRTFKTRSKKTWSWENKISLWIYGKLLKKIHKYHLAVEQFKLLFDINQLQDTKYFSNANCVIRIAVCYEKLKDVENARKYYLKAIEINDGTTNYFFWYADFLKDVVGDYKQ